MKKSFKISVLVWLVCFCAILCLSCAVNNYADEIPNDKTESKRPADSIADQPETGTTTTTCEHNYSDWTVSTPATGHTWSAWTTTTEPTTAAPGTAERHSTECGAIETDTIPQLTVTFNQELLTSNIWVDADGNTLTFKNNGTYTYDLTFTKYNGTYTIADNKVATIHNVSEIDLGDNNNSGCLVYDNSNPQQIKLSGQFYGKVRTFTIQK